MYTQTARLAEGAGCGAESAINEHPDIIDPGQLCVGDIVRIDVEFHDLPDWLDTPPHQDRLASLTRPRVGEVMEPLPELASSDEPAWSSLWLTTTVAMPGQEPAATTMVFSLGETSRNIGPAPGKNYDGVAFGHTILRLIERPRPKLRLIKDVQDSSPS